MSVRDCDGLPPNIQGIDFDKKPCGFWGSNEPPRSHKPADHLTLLSIPLYFHGLIIFKRNSDSALPRTKPPLSLYRYFPRESCYRSISGRS